MMKDRDTFPGKVGLQQRVLPGYRAPLFDLLSSKCLDGLSVFAGQPRADEGIQEAGGLGSAIYFPAKNQHFSQGRTYLCHQRGWREWLEEWDPDVLILEANPRYISNRNAQKWMQKRGRPVIGWGLGSPHSSGLFSETRRRIRKRYLFEFDALIAYSSMGAEQYAELGVPPGRIHVAINSATLPPQKPPDRPVKVDGKLVILFVGRLQARKRVDLLLRACTLVEPSPECWIVGDGPERSMLEHLSEEVFPAAKFLGAKQGQELTDLFTKADLFVLPGTGGLAIQEAMAYGLPVIVAEGDGTQRDLVTADNGWLIQPGSMQELIQAMRQAISDPGRLVEMGNSSFQIVRDRANIEAMAKVFVNVMISVSKGQG
jgi:glycosyltransferase involved in cell wall biosynthesis